MSLPAATLLRGAAQRIQRCVRETDTVAGLGGDEFSVILPDITHRRHAELIAGKIVQELVRPFKHRERHALAVRECGRLHLLRDAAHARNVAKNADLAMYAAKSAGRNPVALFAAAP